MRRCLVKQASHACQRRVEGAFSHNFAPFDNLDEDHRRLAALDALKEHYKSKRIEKKRAVKSATAPRKKKF